MRIALALIALAAPVALCVMSARADEAPLASPKGEPEYGHGLTADDAGAGWVSLFDGHTAFGWNDKAVVKDGNLSGGTTTTTRFGAYELRADVVVGGSFTVGREGKERVIDAPPGRLEARVEGVLVGPIRLRRGVVVRSIVLRPLGMEDMFNGKDLDGWTVIRRAGDDRDRAAWTVENGALRAVGGPGALERRGRHGHFVLQAHVKTRSPMANGGLFFRCIPGGFLNGYEVQIYNAGRGGDPSKPAEYSTGAIDDRQSARRVPSRDGEPFMMTVVAVGAHVATWVNGYQLTDWTDTRPRHDNPRQGLRVEPGTIQFQAHDPDTDLEFRNIRAAALD